MDENERTETTEAAQNQPAPQDESPATADVGASEQPQKKKLGQMKFSECKGGGQKFAWLMNYIFIDGMSGMALGLFATLIAGTIVWQIGNLIDKGGSNFFGLALEAIGKVAQISMGAGIGVGVCLKMKKTSPLVVASACAAGMIGSYASTIIGFTYNYENMT